MTFDFVLEAIAAISIHHCYHKLRLSQGVEPGILVVGLLLLTSLLNIVTFSSSIPGPYTLINPIILSLMLSLGILNLPCTHK